MYYIKVALLVVITVANFQFIMSNGNDVLHNNQKADKQNIEKRNKSLLDNTADSFLADDESNSYLDDDIDNPPEELDEKILIIPGCRKNYTFAFGRCRKITD